MLVGHSLGAIIAGAFATANQRRVAGLLLLSPAGGYGAASAELRESERDQRLAMLEELGPHGLAENRSANMLSAHASDEAREWVRWNMSRVSRTATRRRRICSQTPISPPTSRATAARIT